MPLENKNINKDLILREKLAIERTEMANDRTLLSFIRTGLYFSIAGLTINQLLELRYGWALEVFFWIAAIAVVTAGMVRYVKQKRKIVQHKKNIGNYQLEWDGTQLL